MASCLPQGERSLLILTNSEWKAFHTRNRAGDLHAEWRMILAQLDRTHATLPIRIRNGSEFVPASGVAAVPNNGRFYACAKRPTVRCGRLAAARSSDGLVVPDRWTLYPNMPSSNFLDGQGRLWFENGSNVVVHRNGRFEHPDHLRSVLERGIPDGSWSPCAPTNALRSCSPGRTLCCGKRFPHHRNRCHGVVIWNNDWRALDRGVPMHNSRNDSRAARKKAVGKQLPIHAEQQQHCPAFRGSEAWHLDSCFFPWTAL